MNPFLDFAIDHPLVCVAAATVAAFAFAVWALAAPARPRTSGDTLDFTRKRIG